jgi:hypothetical protein
VKTVFLISVVALPLALIALVARRVGFTIAWTLLASVAGVFLAVLLFTLYNQWKAAQILLGRSPGAVAWLGTADPSTRLVTWLTLCGIGLVIGFLAIVARWAYIRSQSA